MPRMPRRPSKWLKAIRFAKRRWISRRWAGLGAFARRQRERLSTADRHDNENTAPGAHGPETALPTEPLPAISGGVAGIFICYIPVMKTDRIRINKSPQQPEGIEIELVKPENPVEENLLSFLL